MLHLFVWSDLRRPFFKPFSQSMDVGKLNSVSACFAEPDRHLLLLSPLPKIQALLSLGEDPSLTEFGH